MKIPFTKAHGAQNDFLLTWAHLAPRAALHEAARAICSRHTGVGADGWILVQPGAGDTHGSIRLYNADGSQAEVSGNGTRCAAAFLLDTGLQATRIRLATGAGVRELRLIARSGLHFELEMNMGKPALAAAELVLPLALDQGTVEVTLLDVGNPQCVVVVQDFDFDWRTLGRRIESHERFPQRTNVSFVKVIDRHTIEVVFWERGAGETMSSGTGSSGAAAAVILRGLVESPVEVRTPAGPLPVHWESEDLYLSGPADIVAAGEFYWENGG